MGKTNPSPITELIGQVRDRINSKQHGDNTVPEILLGKEGYHHPQYGRTGTPSFTVVAWMAPSGPAA
jgi:hypothetical protein